MAEQKQIIAEWNSVTLFDDESVKEKLTVMGKWDAMFDDSRNPDPTIGLEDIEDFLELGGEYKVEFKITKVN